MVTTLADVGITEEDVKDAIRTRLVVKRESIAKWRSRYPKREYPLRMAINGMCAIILFRTVAEHANAYFDNPKKTAASLNQALDVVHFEAEVEHMEIAKVVNNRVLGQCSTFGKYNFSDSQYKSALQITLSGINGDSAAVESLEYNWVYWAFAKDLVEFWMGFGLVGMSRENAMKKVYFFIKGEHNPVGTPGQIRGAFIDLASVILTLPDSYHPAPNFW